MLAAATNLGYGLMFLATRLLPVLALLNILPSAGFFGNTPSPLAILR